MPDASLAPSQAASPTIEEDSASRQAALDPGRSFIVQAPAGSGKTELLIQRVLVLLARVEEPEQIVAITFTRKAAAEMRQRVLHALAGMNEAPPEPPHKRLTYELAREVAARDAERRWHLGENPARLRMLTFDALCREITLRRPLLARLGGAPDVTDDAAVLYRDAARATLAEVERSGAAGEAMSRLLLHLDGDGARAEGLIVRMLARRDQWLRHLPAPQWRPDGTGSLRAALEAALRDLVRDGLRDLCMRWGQQQRAELEALIGYAAAQRADRDAVLARWEGLRLDPEAGDSGALADALEGWRAAAALLLTGDGAWRKPRGITERQGFPAPGSATTAGEKARRAEMKARIGALLDALTNDEPLRESLFRVSELPYFHYPEPQWDVLDALLTLLPVSLRHLRDAFAARREMDFGEVTASAARVLEQHVGAGDSAGGSDPMRHLLVDEFQDTSHGQHKLIEALTAGWRDGDGHSLFLVGDPMQSIYRFREAEVGLFLHARLHGIGALRLVPLRLTVNHRAQRALVDWINAALPHALPAEESVERAAVPFTPACAAPRAAGGPRPQVHPAADRNDGAEAEQVARIARQASAQGSVAVLVRSRSHLSSILSALREAGVIFRAVETEPLALRPAVQDLLALTRALLHGADRIAWLAVLRAPWCGLRLEHLLSLAGADPTIPLWKRIAEPPADLPAEALVRLNRVRAALGRALESEGRHPLRGWVEETWTALGGPACVDASGLAEAQAYFELLDRLDVASEPVDAERIAEAIQRLFAPPDPTAGDAVHVMTIHAAKGLEFDTVILPGLGKSPRPDDPDMLLWWERPDARRGGSQLLLAPLGERGEREPFHAYLRGIERDKARHETGRLLYVAVTRARQALHLLGHARAHPRKDSFLERLWPAVEASFGALEKAEAAPNVEPARPSGEIRRLVEGWQLPAPPPRVQPALASPGFADPVSADDELGPPPPEYLWAGTMARHVGTVVHRALQRMAELGEPARQRAWIERRRLHHSAHLARLGVAPAQMEKALERVEAALARVIADARGHWVLGAHAESECELALTAWEHGRPVEVILDRTFLDERGVRWIVDYKTGSHEGGEPDLFLDAEQRRHQPQLERYARILARLRGNPPGAKIMLGLYFPLLQGWREWEAPL